MLYVDDEANKWENDYIRLRNVIYYQLGYNFSVAGQTKAIEKCLAISKSNITYTVLYINNWII